MSCLQVPYISQKDRYPTGCESVSTVMLLNYLGYPLSVDQFIENYLKMCPFETRDGILYGADPRLAFCGSPYDEDSFGCYAPVIIQALEKIVWEDYVVVDETGTPVEKLITKYIEKGMPVIFWACIDMKEPIPGPSWKLPGTGEDFSWISNEHCMLLIGSDEEGYFFNDPYENHGRIHYPKALTEARHTAQYSMAIGLKKR
jgi:uncharacterized protein YvpB